MKYKWIYLMALLILGIPFISLAKTCDVDKVFINSISVSNKSENVIEIENAQANKKQVDINLNMKEKNDFIEYKIEVKNESDEDFYFDKNLIIGHSKYIDYKLSSDDNSYIVKGNSSKKMTIKVYLKEDVAQADYTDGIYSEDNIFVINISNERIKNPLTGRNYYIMLLSIIMITVLFTFILWKKDKQKSVTFILLVLGTLVLSPICINALCKAEFKINSKVTISTKSLSSFNISCAGDEKFYFYEGMTFGDWVKSNLYPGNIGGDYESLEDCLKTWGDNKGCKLEDTNHVYSYIDTTDYYYETQEECSLYWDNGCELVSNVYGQTEARTKYEGGDFATLEECEKEFGAGACMKTTSRSIIFDSLEECEQEYGVGSCTQYLWTSYVAMFEVYVQHQMSYYSTLEECTNHEYLYNYYPDSYCLFKEHAYRHTENIYENFDTLEECQDYSDEKECVERTVNTYSPTYRDSLDNGSSQNGYFHSPFESVYFYRIAAADNRVYSRDFPINQKISSRSYSCIGQNIAECVSPESNILSGSKTIKAKDIKVNDLVSYYDFKTNKVEIGKVGRVYIHEDATSFIKLTFEDNSYIEMTDYHPIYTSTGWKSYTNRNGYPKPKVGDLVKSNNGYKKLVEIKPYVGKEDFYDFEIISKDGKRVNNYFANGALVQGSYNN